MNASRSLSDLGFGADFCPFYLLHPAISRIAGNCVRRWQNPHLAHAKLRFCRLASGTEGETRSLQHQKSSGKPQTRQPPRSLSDLGFGGWSQASLAARPCTRGAASEGTAPDKVDFPEESVGFRACQAIFDDFRLIQGGESGVWLGQMSISPTQKQVKRAKIEPKHLNPTDSEGMGKSETRLLL